MRHFTPILDVHQQKRHYCFPEFYPPMDLLLSKREKRLTSRARWILINLCQGLENQISGILATAEKYNRKRGAYLSLEHELAKNFRLSKAPAGTDHRNRLIRINHEVNAYHLHGASLRNAISARDKSAFFGSIQKICSTAAGTGPWRNTAVATAPDADGVFWMYPDANTVSRSIARLFTYLTEKSGHCQVVKACVAYIAIVSIHPFLDGNGRTARVVFNALLTEKSPDVYIPLRQLFQLANFGEIIRMRLVHLQGSWGEMIVFLCATVEAYYVTMRQALRQIVTPTAS